MPIQSLQVNVFFSDTVYTNHQQKQIKRQILAMDQRSVYLSRGMEGEGINHTIGRHGSEWSQTSRCIIGHQHLHFVVLLDKPFGIHHLTKRLIPISLSLEKFEDCFIWARAQYDIRWPAIRKGVLSKMHWVIFKLLVCIEYFCTWTPGSQYILQTFIYHILGIIIKKLFCSMLLYLSDIKMY